MVLDFKPKPNDSTEAPFEGDQFFKYLRRFDRDIIKTGETLMIVLVRKWNDGGPQVCWSGLFFGGPPSMSTS